MTDRHLDAAGKGETSYDYANDVFTFKIKGRNYKKSIEFENFIIDADEEGFITGIRILDASQVIGVDKYTLRNIVQTKFQAKKSTDNRAITVSLQMIGKVRNRLIPLLTGKQNLLQNFSAPIDPKQHLSVFEQPVTA